MRKLTFAVKQLRKKPIPIKQSKGKESIPVYLKLGMKTDYDRDLTTA